MSRSGYSDDCGGWELIRYRGAVASAIRGKRGQEFLRELLAALDALPEKKLIADALQADGAYCALGSVAHARGLPPETLSRLSDAMYDADAYTIADEFGINEKLAREIMFMNDEYGYGDGRDGSRDELRFRQFRDWVEEQLIEWDSVPA